LFGWKRKSTLLNLLDGARVWGLVAGYEWMMRYYVIEGLCDEGLDALVMRQLLQLPTRRRGGERSFDHKVDVLRN
jgi:hypothetical protein